MDAGRVDAGVGMTYDADFESYSDGAGAHQQGLESRHLVEIHPIRVEQRRWRRFSTIAYDITCSCNWWTKATYSAEAERLADEHALLAGGEVLQSRERNS